MPTAGVLPAAGLETKSVKTEEAREDSGSSALMTVAAQKIAAQRSDQRDPVLFCDPVAQLPVQLDVVVPVREFRVRNLLALGPGQVIGTRWANGEDVPLVAGEEQLAWSEFEVIESQLAVRITRVA